VTVRPFLKWVGGKTSSLPTILPRLPEKIRTYYEPFLGAGAVFFALAAEGRFKKAVVGDANEELVETYSSLLVEPDRVITLLSRHVYEEVHYYAVRKSTPRTSAGRAARMIYLNRTGFNGLYRVNKKGEFNVPFGRYTNPTICDEDNLRAVHRTLSSGSSMVLHRDFREIVKGARKGDAVYFDPPYVPLSGTADFTAFVKGGFDEGAHTRLRDCFAALDARGVHVLLSNSDTPLVRKLYKGFPISQVKAPRRVNSRGDKRGDVNELLISGRNTS
jgi:DNA adenine methylase